MDEPLGALDRKLRIEMQLELKRLQARLGVTVIYVTHDQEEALTLSDRIAVMKGGRIEQLGEPAELYENPRTAFVAQFIGESDRLEGTVRDASDGGAVLITPSGLRLPVRSGGVPPGEPALLFLRPERIAIAPDGEAGGGAVTGDVVEAVFVGETMRYVVRTAGGETFTVKRLNLDATDRFKVGARVTLRWPPDAAFTQRRQP
jgi:spermidine/putrescine transport system ATP-binding protein